MKNKVLVIDFETRWSSKDYTLSKLTTEEYIRDERFKAFGLGFKELGDDKIHWISGDNIQAFVDTVDWRHTAVLAHNAQFDVAILSWVFGARPRFIFDTLSMARALRGIEVGNSLMRLASEFNLPPKGNAVHSTDGMTDLPQDVELELAEYCKHDVFLCEEIFKRLVDGYPKDELYLIDMTLKMYTDPKLELDGEMLNKALTEENKRIADLLSRLNIAEEDLASDAKFANLLQQLGVEAPTKVSKKTGKTAYAFAKNDALFQALVDSDNEDIALLCEARLRVKSTIMRTRAQRFLDISKRGRLPVPLHYYGAHTGRWSAARGSGINLQNLKRKSSLRNAICAPEGYTVVVSDLSQIEPRVLAWLADYQTVLELFRGSADVYAAFGAKMFGVPNMTKESHPDLRQSAKSALLGCFGPDTKVLTTRGWVPIISVRATDMLWDGIEWVKHQGLVPQGVKDVVTAWGISATPDHEILTERGWVEWKEVLTNHSLIQKAHRLANLPLCAGKESREAQSLVRSINISHGVDALVGGKVLSKEQTYVAVELQDAILALRKSPKKRVWLNLALQRFAPMVNTAIDYSIELVQLLLDALTQKAKPLQTTAVAGLQYTQNGLQIVRSFLRTLYLWMDGTNLNYNLTVLTTTAAMPPAIFDSSVALSTRLINAKPEPVMLKNLETESEFLKQKMQTYDIAYAGPRNRYTILTDSGPLLVHNCGYGMGWLSFGSQLLTGFLGAPPVLYDKKFAKQLGIGKDEVKEFFENEDNVEKALAIPRRCTDAEIITHCVAAKHIINAYRKEADEVKQLWRLCDDMLYECLDGGDTYEFQCIEFRKGEIVLPNGMALRYPNLKAIKGEDKRTEWVYGETGKKIYGSKIVENIVQALARIVMTDAMLRINKRYQIVLTVHDELVAVVPDQELEEAKDWIHAQMIMEPAYMPSLPLGAETESGKRYGEAK